MAPAVVHLDESNEYPEVVTHTVTSLAMGTVDATGMVPGAPGARQPADSDSMQKSLRVHLTDLGGGGGITRLRAFCDPPAAGWSLWTNGTEEPSNYELSKITEYVAPTDSQDEVPHALPVADGDAANLGIGGELDGELTGPGQSDYLYLQLRADETVTTGFTAPFFIAYDEIG